VPDTNQPVCVRSWPASPVVQRRREDEEERLRQLEALAREGGVRELSDVPRVVYGYRVA
jgi:hypothetical protein